MKPRSGTPFEPHLHGFARRDGQPFATIGFAAACPLATAVDALMMQAKAVWLRATPPDLHVLLWVWGQATPDTWPDDPEMLAAALVRPTRRLTADLRRLGIVVEPVPTDRGPAIDLLRVTTPTWRARYPRRRTSR